MLASEQLQQNPTKLGSHQNYVPLQPFPDTHVETPLQTYGLRLSKKAEEFNKTSIELACKILCAPKFRILCRLQLIINKLEIHKYK